MFFGKRFQWDNFVWSEALFLLFDKLKLTERGSSGPPPQKKKNLRMMLIEVFMLLFIAF